MSRRAAKGEDGRDIPPHDSGGGRGRLPPPALDRYLHAAMAPVTFGISPVTLTQAFGDWALHFRLSPDKQIEAGKEAVCAWLRYAEYLPRAAAGPACADCVEPEAGDRRFRGDAWRLWPFNALRQGFLLTERWWRAAAADVPGVSRHHERVIGFVIRHWLDLISPASFPLTNPEVLNAARRSGGYSFLRGAINWVEDGQRALRGAPPAGAERFAAGRNLAVTPGKVIFRNELIELIQYTPATDRVRPEPVLIVPAWLLKYYILDLSPENSLVGFLTDRGHTVFMISWKNPSSEDRDLGLEDYRTRGLMAALDAVAAVLPGRRIHAAGYCLGGTLLAIAAAAMSRDGDDRLASLSFFATQTDFTETGQLMLFLDEAQVRFLEDLMALRGYLDTRPLVGLFRLLRPNELVGSAMRRNYLMGERRPMTDLMAWNMDATRLPERAHSEYLRRLVLGNELAEGRYVAGGNPVCLRDIRIPIFAVSALRDHVAPWRSVFRIHGQTRAEVTFVLSSGGHNAGIVSPPGESGRYYRIARGEELSAAVDTDAWRRQAARHSGSWWPRWRQWLADRSGPPEPPPEMGAAHRGLTPLCDAPGTYVLMP